MAELLSKLEQLQSLDPRQHWFCGRVDDAPDEPALQPADKDELRQLLVACFQVYAYEWAEIEKPKERLVKSIDLQLTKCEDCIVEYYRLRRLFLDSLRVDYEEEDVEALDNILYDYELQRIWHGLQAAAVKLSSVPSGQRSKKDLTNAQAHAVLEALSNEKFLLDSAAVQESLLGLLTDLRGNDGLFPMQYLPGVAEFLFKDSDVLRAWANRALGALQGPMKKPDFDFAFRHTLERILAKTIIPPYDPNLVRLLWLGLTQIVDHMDSDGITHLLRSLDADVYKQALEHIQLDDESLRYILQTIKKLLETSPKDMWEAMGAIAPKTFAEQVFRSPKFEDIMLNARSGNADDPSSALSDMLVWIEPFMESLQIGNRPPVCRFIVDQLLARIRSNALGPEGRIACWREALRLLASTLSACNKSTSLSDAVGRAVAADALSCANAYMDDVLDILERPGDDKQAQALSASCIVIVQSALSLECKIIYNDRTAIANGKHLTGIGNLCTPDTWKKIVKRMGQDSVSMARPVVGAGSDLLYLEKIVAIDNEKLAPEAEAVNEAIGGVFLWGTKALERISYFSMRCLRELVQYPDATACLVTMLLCTEQAVHDSASELMKSATGEQFRRDAIRSLLGSTIRETLNAISESMQLLCYLGSYVPCTRLLKVCSDVTWALTDSQDGLLRQTATFDRETIASVLQFWGQHWKALKMMANTSQRWNRERAADAETLKEFVRDVIQASDTLFDQFNVFNNVVARSKHGTVDETAAQEASTQELLGYPADATEGIQQYLRLKDSYLLRTSVQLIRKLLSTLTKHSLELPTDTTRFLTEVAIFNDSKVAAERFGIRTLLQPTEIAGIAQDLENNLGYDAVQQARDEALIERNMIEDNDVAPVRIEAASTASERSLLLQPQKKKQGTIDFQNWGIRADANREVERKKVPETSKPRPKETRPPVQGVGTFDRGTPSLSKIAAGKKSVAEQKSFLESRKKAKEEAERKKAEELAKIKKNIPGLIAGQTAHEGSAISRLGKTGKDHTPKGEAMMLSSDSDSSDSDGDDFDATLFPDLQKPRMKQPSNQVSLASIPQKPRGPVKKMRVQRSAKDMRARLAPQMTGLYAKLLSWDFFHEGDFPPDTTKEDFAVVKDSFRTAQEYRSSFESLLLLEAWSSFCKAREEASFRPFEIKVANRISVDSLFEVSVTLDMALCKEVSLREGDILLISKASKPQDNPKEAHCLGRASKLRFKRGVAEVTIQVSSGGSVHPWITQGASLHVVQVESIITLEREYGALCGLEWYDLCQEIIRAEVSPILTYTERAMESLQKNYRLNLAQTKAVQSAIDNDAFTLIQGPPGSGKTKTIVAIVGALLTNALNQPQAVAVSRPMQPGQQSNATGNAKKLLVCAPSNAAVDELVLRFMAGVKTIDGRFHKPSVLRLGRSDRVNPQVMSVTLDEKIDKILNPLGEKVAKEESELQKAMNAHKAADTELKGMYLLFEDATARGVPTSHEQSKKFEQLKRTKQTWSNQIERLRDSGNTAVRDADIKRRQAEQRVLNESQIICATLSGSARETFQHLTVDFESVVIDEAAQCIELSALIPLKYGCAKCIMVGDPKQLPPTVLSREAARFQYEQSLFVRMQRNRPKDVHLLDTQYRMHPEISRFPSKIFYDERLLDGPDMAKLRTQAWHKDKLLGPYRFYDVAGKQQAAPKGHSLVNRDEINAALELYRRLISSIRKYDFTQKIGIITPYKSQLWQLKEQFSKVYGPDITKTIEFNTTDAFQGRESEIIIFSCVRASERGIGFLSDIRRMNVGITRAKSSLWVLGNSRSLMQGEYWNAMITDARARGLVSEGNILQLLRETPKVISDATATKEPSPPPKEEKPKPPAAIPRAPISSSSSDSGDDTSDSDPLGLADMKKEEPRLPIKTESKPIKKEFEDTEMPDAPAPAAVQPARQPSEAPSGTSTPKRKRSTSPSGPPRAVSKANNAAPGSKPAPKQAPPPPRPRKPTGDDAMFIKPKRKK